MAKKELLPTEVVTGVCRASYANVYEAKSINGGKEKYSVAILIKKSDKATVAAVKKAIQAAYEAGKSKLQGNGKSVPKLENVWNPLRDGDKERPDDENYAGCFYVNAKSDRPPEIVNRMAKESDHRLVYSGCFCKFFVNFYAFAAGEKGIACGLQKIQFIADGEPLGGNRYKAEDVFDVEDYDDDEAFLG